MKHILSIIMLLFASGTIYGQFDNEIGWSPGAIEWSDPVYDDFFNSSCPQSMAKSAKLAKIITKFYQNDPIWANNPYGHCPNTDCSCGTFSAKGCYLTCISMMLTNSGDYIDPWNLNQFTFFDNCYYDQATGCDLNADNILNNRPFKTLKGLGRFSNSQNNFDIVKIILNNDGFVVAKVNGSGSCSHFILIYDWETINGIDIFYTADPFQSSVTKRDLSQYTTCQFRYYIPRNNSQVQNLILNGTATKIKQVLSGERVIIGVGSTLKSATITDCSKRLWVVKNEYGQVVDQQANTDTYTFNQFGQFINGAYYVSYAINNEFGFDGESVQIIVGNGSGGGPIVVDPPNHCVNPPTCGNGICDPGEVLACNSCNWECGGQFVDEGFRINGYFDNVVSVCRNGSIELTPKRGSFYFGKEIEYHTCIESVFCLFLCKCPYYYNNSYKDIIECNDDLTETSTAFHYASRFESDTDSYKESYVDCRNLTEGKYYKIVLKTYFDDNVPYAHPEGWISSFKYIYILPYSDMYYDSSSYDEHIAHPEIAIVGQTISGNVVVKAQNSIKIYQNTFISANFNAIIDPNLPVVCNGTKSAKIDTLNISDISNVSDISIISDVSDNTKNISHDIKALGSIEESNISIYPNPNNGSFTVLLKNDAVSEISVINMFGQEVCYNINKTTDSSLSVTLSDSSDGIYIVKLKGKQKTYVRKIFVKTK